VNTTDPPARTTTELDLPQTNAELVYRFSPDDLKVPAFICKCGHPHRFLCVTCGMTLKEARGKKGTRWVEYVPEIEPSN
jgi:hypothetical protein